LDYSTLAAELYTRISAMEQEMARSRMHQAARVEMRVLEHVSRQTHAISPGEISSATGKSTAHIAIALKNLEKHGFIVRTPDTEDRRRTGVTITERGRSFFDSRHEFMRGRWERILRGLGDEDAIEYVRLATRVQELAHKIDFEEFKEHKE
jgi:DNA-binding MarR family transcriptional regulator